MMKSNRRNEKFLGLLLILGIVFGITSSVPALEQPGYLVKLSEIETQVLFAVFSQAAMAVAYVLIAVLLYPILNQHNKSLAAGYFGFRIIGAGFLFIGISSLLLLLWLSQSYTTAEQADASYFQTIAELLRRGRDMMNHIGMILPWSIGGLVLYYGFYQLKLVPRWLSIWGMAGAVLTLVATILLMLNMIPLVNPLYFILNAPTALFEMIFAVYLIVKGFKPVELPHAEHEGTSI